MAPGRSGEVVRREGHGTRGASWVNDESVTAHAYAGGADTSVVALTKRPTIAPLAIVIGAACAAAGCGGSGPASTPTAHVVPAVKRAARKPVAPPTLAHLVAGVSTGIIRIEADTCDGQSIGTGFLLGPRLVATVEHVVDGATALRLKQGRKVIARGTVIGQDPARDVALVRTSKPVIGHIFTLGTTTPALGDDVAALGFPLGLPLSVTKGSVSGTGRTIPIDGVRRRSLVQTDAAVNPGNSGGPLLSMTKGDVVGLVDLGTNDANGIAFAVASRVAGPLLDAWSAAPQPVAATTCAATAPGLSALAPPATTPTSTGTQTFSGGSFSIDYPDTWDVKAAEVQKPYGSDTTMVSPDDSSLQLTVDITPGVSSSDPMALAQPVVDALRRQSGYSELDLALETFNGYDAVHWEFEVREHGQLLHKENQLFVDSSGDGVAILTQAAAGEYGSLADSFAQLRSSFSG
jgi:S1-C subfamily serine protease